jgi:hypothetical protein
MMILIKNLMEVRPVNRVIRWKLKIEKFENRFFHFYRKKTYFYKNNFI